MRDDLINVVACPICGSESSVIDSGKTINRESDAIAELRECCACRHWWNSPMPTQSCLNGYYSRKSEFVVPGGYNDQVENQQIPKVALREYEAWYEKYGKGNSGGKCLEIGVGAGYFFRYLAGKGFECHGIDPGNWNPSIRLFENVESLPKGLYDQIFVFDVLEHLHDPKEMLLKLKGIARKGANLYCTFPNKDSIPAQRLKARWEMVRPYGHLHYFSRKSVAVMFGDAGWGLNEVKAVNALHNRYYSSLNLLDVARKLLTPYSYWKDQFWVRAIAD